MVGMMGKECEALLESIEFNSCGWMFRNLELLNVFATEQCQEMINLSELLLKALAFHWRAGTWTSNSVGLFGSAEAWQIVFSQGPGLPKNRRELKRWREYWRFINRMRSVAIHIGFRCLPHSVTAAELKRMAQWCYDAAR